MAGYINNFDENKNKNKSKNKNTITMSLKVKDKDKPLLRNCNKIWKKIERLMSIEIDSKPSYGDDDKYIKTKIKAYEDSITKKSLKNTRRKNSMEMFTNNNARFCSLCI